MIEDEKFLHFRPLGHECGTLLTELHAPYMRLTVPKTEQTKAKTIVAEFRILWWFFCILNSGIILKISIHELTIIFA